MHTIDPSALLVASTVALLVFVVLSGIDGGYVHIVRYRLHAHPESWGEHVWHTGRAILFPLLLLTLFATLSGGPLLWAGLSVLALDQVLEIGDGISEKDSRARHGGLSSSEYLLHLALTSARAAAIALSLAARPLEAWSLDAPLSLAPLPGPWGSVVLLVVPGAIVTAVHHLWLAVKHRPGARVAQAAPAAVHAQGAT